MMGYHKTNLTIGQQTIFLKSHTQFNRATNKRETIHLGQHITTKNQRFVQKQSQTIWRCLDGPAPP
jgi:hypothetical protein